MNERQIISARQKDWIGFETLEQLSVDIHCMDNVCTHAYALLGDGWLDGTASERPLHGGRFDILTGKALCAPASEDLVVYQTRTIDNHIKVLIPE